MIWYPYEQMKTMREPYKILDAEGVYLYTKDQKLIDSVSSWWCMIHGYKHPELTAAIKEQADHFCHVMLGGLTHEPVQKLTQKLERRFGLLLFLGFRKCCGGSLLKDGITVQYKSGQKTSACACIRACLPRGYV